MAFGRSEEGRSGRRAHAAQVRTGWLIGKPSDKIYQLPEADRDQGRRHDAVSERGGRYRCRGGRGGGDRGAAHAREVVHHVLILLPKARGSPASRWVSSRPTFPATTRWSTRRLCEEVAEGLGVAIPDSLHAQRQGDDRPDAARRHLRKASAQARRSTSSGSRISCSRFRRRG